MEKKNEGPIKFTIWDWNGHRVATIEHEDRGFNGNREGICKGCKKNCCLGHFCPTLTKEEFLSKKYKMKIIPLPDWMKEKGISADYLVTLAINVGEPCPYLGKDGLCTIFEERPQACRNYDCRQDPRMREK